MDWGVCVGRPTVSTLTVNCPLTVLYLCITATYDWSHMHHGERHGNEKWWSDLMDQSGHCLSTKTMLCTSVTSSFLYTRSERTITGPWSTLAHTAPAMCHTGMWAQGIIGGARAPTSTCDASPQCNQDRDGKSLRTKQKPKVEQNKKYTTQ